VKLGVDVSTTEHVALKLIDKQRMGERQLQQLHREIDAMKSLYHPNILELKQVIDPAQYPKSDGSVVDVILLVLELAVGGELFDFLMHTGAFAEDLARTYFRQLILALKCCHEHRIFHRDIKPENLLLDAQFQLKVADFGLSSVQEEDGVTLYTECGTRSYMAPEVLIGQGYDGALADLWSAGVVLFIMIAGNPPFQQANKRDWWFNAVSLGRHDRFWAAHLRSCPTFPVAAQTLLNRIFVADPELRATLDDVLQDPWMQGTILTTEQIVGQMALRQERVNAQKQAEREAARLKNSRRRVHEPFDRNTNRSSTTSAIPIPALPADYVPGRTTFYTIESPVGVLQSLQTIMQELGTATTELRESEYQLKAQLRTSGDRMELDGEVVELPGAMLDIHTCMYETEDGIYLVDIQKNDGDVFAFEKLFREMLTRLGSVAVAGTRSNEEEPGADEDLLSDDIGMI
jgi:serine/threonine protein kinase